MGTVNVNHTPLCDSCTKLTDISYDLSVNSHINQIVNALHVSELHTSIDVPNTNTSYPASGYTTLDITTRKSERNDRRSVEITTESGDTYTRKYKYIFNDMQNYIVGTPFSIWCSYTAVSDIPTGQYVFNTELGYIKFTSSVQILTGYLINFEVKHNVLGVIMTVYDTLSTQVATIIGEKCTSIPAGATELTGHTSRITYFGSVDDTEAITENDALLLIRHLYGAKPDETLSNEILQHASCTYGSTNIYLEDIVAILRYLYPPSDIVLTDAQLTTLYEMCPSGDVFVDLLKMIAYPSNNTGLLLAVCDMFNKTYTVRTNIMAAGDYYFTIDDDTYGMFTLDRNLEVGTVLEFDISQRSVFITMGTYYMNVPFGIGTVPSGARISLAYMSLYKIASLLAGYTAKWICISDWKAITMGCKLNRSWYAHANSRPSMSFILSEDIPESGMVVTGPFADHSKTFDYELYLSECMTVDRFTRFNMVVLSSINRANIYIKFTATVKYSTDGGKTYTTINNNTSVGATVAHLVEDEVVKSDISVPISSDIPLVIPSNSYVLIQLTAHTHSTITDNLMQISMYAMHGDDYSLTSFTRSSTTMSASEIKYDATLMGYNATTVQEAIDHLLSGGGYSLPAATVETLGGVKIDDVTIKIDPTGVIRAVTSGATAAGVTYDNTESGMEAEQVQDAIDELNTNKLSTDDAYTKEEIDTALLLKSDATHNHDLQYADILYEHSHVNKTTIDKFSELDGELLFDGESINSNTTWGGISDKPFSTLNAGAFIVNNDELDIVPYTWVGTTAEWNALDKTDLPDGIRILITDDVLNGSIDTVVTQGSYRAVSSGGVYNALQTLNATTIYKQMAQPTSDGLWIRTTQSNKGIKIVDTLTAPEWSTPIACDYDTTGASLCEHGPSLYIVGAPNNASRNVCVYSVSKYTLQFTQIGNLNYPVSSNNCSCINAGMIYTFGVDSNNSTTTGLQILNISSGECTTVDLGIDGLIHASVVSIGTTCYIIGGYFTTSFAYSDKIYTYDISSGTVTELGAHLATARENIVSAVVGRKIVITGGYNGVCSSLVEIYDTETNTITTSGNITISQVTTGIQKHSISVIGTTLMITGGDTGSGPITKLIYYNIDTGATNVSYYDMPTARRGHQSYLLEAGLTVIGGASPSTTCSFNATRSPNNFIIVQSDTGKDVQIMNGVTIGVGAVRSEEGEISPEAYIIRNGTVASIDALPY